MRIKKYIVNKIDEAKPQIIRDLGKDAIIIHTNRIRAKGIKGWFGKHYYEILAATDEKSQKEYTKHHLNKQSSPVSETKNSELEEIKEQLLENQKLLNNILNDLDHIPSQLPPVYNKIYKFLLNEGINQEKAKKLVNKLREKGGENDLIQSLKKIMLKEIQPILEKGIIPDENKIFRFGLVGPTGVGKTTTIAKLAAHSSLNEKKSLGLITLDNFRIAAAEQLKVYGNILDVPVYVANNLEEYELALKRLNDKERIYVDTAGRSHKNLKELQELKKYFDKLSLDFVFLVLSVTTNIDDLIPIYKTFSLFNPTGLILTKLDEVDRYGNLYNIITHFKKPIYYFTTGQNVPDDIEVLTAEDIIDKILGGYHV